MQSLVKISHKFFLLHGIAMLLSHATSSKYRKDTTKSDILFSFLVNEHTPRYGNLLDHISDVIQSVNISWYVLNEIMNNNKSTKEDKENVHVANYSLQL